MKNYPWFRMYAEAVDDDKLRLLAFEDRWHFVALLCLKTQGVLDEPNPDLRLRRIGVKLGLTQLELETVMDRLSSVRLINPDTWEPLKWDERQYQSDSVDKTAAERMRRFRERKRNGVTVTEPVTGVTAVDAESDTDLDKDKNSDRAAAQPAQHPFSLLKSIYPRRAGSQRWDDAQKHINARLREGHTWQQILDGAERYAKYIRATGKERTETVQQGATFVGKNKGFMDTWDLPATKADARLAANIDVMNQFVGGST